MEPVVLGRRVFKDKTVSIPLQSDCTLMVFYYDICSRFNELGVGAFEMTFLVSDHPPFVLETHLVTVHILLRKISMENMQHHLVIHTCLIHGRTTSIMWARRWGY
ncbi:hypothetical protein L3X38_027203 [Prunus dulcis]|uniref:Uncharacterized protein n=1 Tax=Prunus dulcis TaxID=3755 RepID=A0AAD4VPC3_PRUDU|nr:hypothetical protein L3X38_027203 [Prunus dulcis]